MAVTTKKTFNAVGSGGQSSTTVFTPVSIELNNQDDLDVYVTLSGGTRVLQYRQSTGGTTDSNHPQVNDTTGLYFPAQSTGVTLYNYTLSTDNNTITFNSALPADAVVSVERRTRDSSSDYTNFVGGSTIRHTDVNRAFDESNFTAQEARNKAFEIEGKIFGTEATSTSFITSDEIVDGTIVDADLSSTAEIQVSKLKDGTARQVLQTAANGSDVEWTSNVDIPGTLDVTSSAAFDSNVTVSGTTTAAAINASGAVGVDGNFDVNTNKFTVDSSTGNTVIGGNLSVSGTASITGTSTYTGQQTVPGGALVKNIRVGLDADNEVSTTSGNLILDSANGTVQITDTLDVVGNVTVSGTVDGRDIASDGSKLDGIEAGATADQTASEIRTLVESASDSNVFTDADHSKLNAIEASATADQTASEIKTLLQSDKLTDSEIATGTLDNRYFTETELTGGALDGRYYTETESDARYFNISTGDTIKDGDAFPDNDTTIATTAAINDRIIDLVDDVGGFVPIANELAFPNANPDVNNGAGTLVSIKTLSTNYTSSGSGVISISNGTVGNSTVTINGAENSTTYSSGYGMIVETTTTLNTYTFHRLVPKATEVTTVAGKATEIGRLGTAAAVEDLGILGTTAVVEDLNLLGTAAVVEDMSLLGVQAVIDDMATIADTSNLISNIGTVAGIQANVTTVAGNSANVTSVADNMGTVNDFAARYRVGANNPTSSLDTGDLFFNTSANELKVYNGSSWQGGVTASGNFASVTGNTFTGDNLYNDSVKAKFGTGSDLQIYHDGSNARIYNSTGEIIFRSGTYYLNNAAGDENILKGTADGAVELYHDNTKTFETTATGTNVTGVHVDDGATHDGDVSLNGASYNAWWDKSDSAFKFDDNAKLKVGTGGDLEIYHDGTNSQVQNTTGFLIFNADAGNIDFRFNSSNDHAVDMNRDGAVELYYDNAKKLNTESDGITVTGNIGIGGDAPNYQVHATTSIGVGAHGFNQQLTIENDSIQSLVLGTGYTTLNLNQLGGNVDIANDSSRLRLGTGQDLQIYHDGTNSHINNTTGYLVVGTDSYAVKDQTLNEFYIKALKDGAVELYHDNSIRLATTSAGVNIGGNLSSDSGTSFTVNAGGASGTAAHFIARCGSENAIVAVPNGSVELYYDNVLKLNTESSGTRIQGQLVLPNTSGVSLSIKDNGKAVFGTGDDLQIYHNGSHSYIINGASSGTLNLRSDSHVYIQDVDGNTMADFNDGGAVELYYDGSKKFETTSEGVETQGELHFKAPSSSTGEQVGRLEWWNENDAGVMAKIAVDRTAGSLAPGDLVFSTSANVDTTANGGDGDITERLRITSAGDINIPVDGDKLQFGASQDLQIYHDGSDSYITNATGNTLIQGNTGGNLYLQAHSGDGSIVCYANGSVELYYDGTKKFETNSSGVIVSGNCQFGDGVGTVMGASNDFQIYHDQGNASNTIDGLNHKIELLHSGEKMLVANPDDSVELYHNNILQLETTNQGINVKDDSGAVHIELYTNGSTRRGYVYADDSNRVYLLDAQGHAIVYGQKDAHCSLYYDNSQKFYTQSYGAVIDGTLKPASNNSLDMGDNSYRFHTVWAQNTARAWLNVDGDASTASIRSSNGVSSLTDDAYEQHTVNFDVNMGSASDYCFVSGARAGSSGGGGRVVVGYDTPTASAFKYQMRNLGNSNEHVDAACLAFFST